MSIEDKIESYKEEGKKYLITEKLDEWERILPIRINDLYGGMELDCCLDIAKCLKENDIDKAVITIKSQDHSGYSWNLVVALVKCFSYNTEEFLEKIK